MKKIPLISIIAPCYNEAENLPILTSRLADVLKKMRYEIILIDDGSTDNTAETIYKIIKDYENVKYLRFSRNFGQQTALKAGIDYASGDCIVTLDADLQHPPEKIPEMLALWENGYEIITAIRVSHTKNKVLKNLSSKFFYRVLSYMTDEKIEEGSADFRLLDRKAAEVIKGLEEKDIFLRGIFSWIGYRQITITYQENMRLHGKTKYSLKKMYKLASSGVTSFSAKPLHISLKIGIFFAFIAFIYGIYAVIMLISGNTVTGWTSVIASILFLTGIQLIILGIIGIYLGKLFMENKHRPSYIISESNIIPAEHEKRKQQVRNKKTKKS